MPCTNSTNSPNKLRIRRWTFEGLDIDRLRTRVLRRDHDLYGRLIDAAHRREPHAAGVAVWVLAPHLVDDARRWHGDDRTAALDHRVTIASMVIADVTDTAAPNLIDRVLSRSRRRTIRATFSERGQPAAVVSLADHALGHFDEPDPTARVVTARSELTRVLDTAQQAVAAGRINAADWVGGRPVARRSTRRSLAGPQPTSPTLHSSLGT